jgi:hypothetical protein
MDDDLVRDMPPIINSKRYLRAIVSYLIRRRPRRRYGSLPVITDEWFDRVTADEQLPDPPEQVTNLLFWLGENTLVGQNVDITRDEHQAVIGAHNYEGVRAIVEHLQEQGWIRRRDVSRERPGRDERDTPTGGTERYDAPNVTLTVKGWERYDELRRQVLDSRLAFMAMPFNDDDLKRVYTTCFKPAVAATGFTLRRLDDQQPAGSIDDRLRVEIRRSRFLIAELTGDNQGAYWEAGFAEGLERPVIYTCRRDYIPKVHFDANHHLIVPWEDADLEDAATRLKATIRETFPADAQQADAT